MTFAPPTIKEVRYFLKGQDSDLDDVELGIVGGPRHIIQGTSYHLGKDQLIMSRNPYSARTARDKAGLSNASSALDIDDDLDELRELSVWLVRECRAGASDTGDIREIIYSPEGVRVLRWDRERGINSEPIPDSDLSHREHTHVSWYRDSEFRNKVDLFKRFYQERGNMEVQLDALRNAMVGNTEHYLQSIVGMTPTAEHISNTAQHDLKVPNLFTAAIKAMAADIAELKTRPPITLTNEQVDRLGDQLGDMLKAYVTEAVREQLNRTSLASRE